MNKLGNSTKTAKAPKGWTNLILHLSPMNKAFKIFKRHQDEVLSLAEKRLGHEISIFDIEKIKAFNSCPWAGFCGKICLDTAGRGKFSNVQIARAAKTIHYVVNKSTFILELKKEIERELKKASKKGDKLAVRLNGTSDLDWIEVITDFPEINFYDYVKSKERFTQFLNGELPTNYHLTYSYDRKNDRDPSFVLNALHSGGKIAIMKKDHENLGLTQWHQIDGDSHDLRFFDAKIKRGAFVILQEKGDAKK